MIAPERATVPLWQEEPVPSRLPLAGDANCAVVVVGGGIGGIAAAWHLLERGVRPLVLEARSVAAGASGRNGGFFIAGAAPMYDDARRRWGAARAARIYRATLAAQAEMLAVAAAVGAREHFRILGMLRVAADASEAQRVRAHHAALRADGFPGELVAEADLPAPVRRPGRLGLLTPHDGAVHPVRWLRALAAAVQARGARICEGTPVLAPPALAGDGVALATTAGTVRAERAIVALDGALATLVAAAGAVRPRRLNMLATAPVAPGHIPCPVYVRDGHEYAQQLPDGRVTLGGFSDLDGRASWTAAEEVSPVVQRRLDAYLRAELGVHAAVTHRWAGVVGYAEDPLPRCGPVAGTRERVIAFGGYNGTGHVQAFVAARVAAALALGAGSEDAGLYAPVAG